MEFPGDRPLLQPVRSPGGFRLYSGADELRIRRMQAYLAEGLSGAEAARAALGGDASTPLGYLAGPRRTESAGSEPSAGLRQALDAFDAPGRAGRAGPAPGRSVPPRPSCGMSCFPASLTSAIPGRAGRPASPWSISPATSSVAGSRGLPVAGGAGTGHRPCSPAHPASCTIWRSWFSESCSTGTAGGSAISGQAPRPELERAVGATRADLVVLATTVPEILEPLRPQLGSLARRAPVALTAGAAAGFATVVGARLMAGDPVTEAGQAGWLR